MTTRVARSRKEFSKTLRSTNKMTKKEKRCKRGKRTTFTTGSKEVQVQSAPSTNLLKKLYVTCKDVFKSRVVADLYPSDVQKIRLILDPMVPEDVGIFDFDIPIADDGISRIGYTSIHECKNFSLCIFYLPPNAVIPLHNHPGMTVFSKLLVGTVHAKAYDWVDQVEPEDSSKPLSKVRLAELKLNNVISAPCDTSVLYPTSGGNIHEFRAITPCVILDVIGPPYCPQEGRDCTYYRDIPYFALPMAGEGSLIKEEKAKSYGWLEEIEMPKNVVIHRINYMGPKLINKTTH